jgi:hypothetical protein
MNAVHTTDRHFRADEPVVVLYEGMYNGLSGRFLGLRTDPNWADIQEQNGQIRSHPVVWMRRPSEFPELRANCKEPSGS